MSIDTAKHVISVAFQCGSQLQDLMKILRAQCGPEEYKMYAIGIAASIDKISTELIDRALSSYPELKQEIEQQLQETGRFTP
ncbi:hypothetical protein VE25_04350 [Devosia geojensis]|uniref:Uncharacterized protein n=1 Tax=Devosia geojensis TaxID=443610 RepID=A0A0F5FVV9_9HYPH|nr:hypothetical protein [Devosia geojensis]KKB12999.1 hypothetical protein VE25_04350 [Devosia geojensis]